MAAGKCENDFWPSATYKRKGNKKDMATHEIAVISDTHDILRPEIAEKRKEVSLGYTAKISRMRKS